MVRETAAPSLSRSQTIVVYQAQGTRDAVEQRLHSARSLREFAELSRTYDFDSRRDHSARFQLGDEFYLLVDHSRAVSWGWVARARSFYIEEIDRTVNLVSTLLYDFFTPVEFRGKGYYSTLLKEMRKCVNDRRLTIFALEDNTASVKGIQRAGFGKVGDFRWSSGAFVL